MCAALAGTAVALPGGVVTSQYVGAGLFRYVTSAVVGVLTVAVPAAADGSRIGPVAVLVRVTAVVCALVGVALGFALERSQGVFEAASVLPCLSAAAAAALRTMPPRRGSARSTRASPDLAPLQRTSGWVAAPRCDEPRGANGRYALAIHAE